MDRDLFNFLNGLQAGKAEPLSLKDRMRTTVLRAKQKSKQEFIKLLAEDYIRISKEL